MDMQNKELTTFRYNDEYIMHLKELTYSNHKFSCYEDVLLYVAMLDGDWRLPNYDEYMHICAKSTRYSFYDTILLGNNELCYRHSEVLLEDTTDIKFTTILAISRQYKPTIMKKIKVWLKNIITSG